MGIYRCNHCKHIQEYIYHTSLPPTAKCAKCQQDVTVYDTTFFVEHIISRYVVAKRELESLKNQLNDDETEQPEKNTDALENVSFHESNQLANAKQHQQLANWFKKKNIQVEFNYSAVDMSGFYDEAAEKIGKNYAIFSNILDHMRWGYGKSVSNLNFELKKFNQKEQQQINNLCREFYSYTLFSTYKYLKQDKIIKVKLQTATPVRQFFMGGWLEWFVLNTVVENVLAKKVKFSVARSAKIRFQNEDLHELDVILYTQNGEPMMIECKSGEYRKDLDKYLNLRKRLNIPAQNYILLVLDINDAQAKSMSSMYDLTFATLNTLAECVKKVI